jgi:hypothetical protein
VGAEQRLDHGQPAGRHHRSHPDHYYAHALPVDPGQPLGRQLALFIATGYAFKFVVAAADTLPFYLGVRWLSQYLEIDPTKEHEIDRESAGEND